MVPNSIDLFICGGGVVGLSIAWQASRIGWKVVVADARKIGKGASWAGAGILPPAASISIEDPLEKLRALSNGLHPQWARELKSATEIDNGFSECGGIYLARSNGELATLMAQQSWWTEFSIPFERLKDAKAVHRIVPDVGLMSRLQAAWFLPTESQLRNPRHLQALKSVCESNGVHFLEDTSILDWEFAKDHLAGVITSAGRFQADRYIVTAGAWSQKLLQPLHAQTGVMPVRGQMILYKLPSRRWSPILNEGHRYLVPRDDGHVLAGSCEEEVGFLETTTDEMIDQLHRWAVGVAPVLDSAERVRTWAGLRPGSFDSLPYLGKIPRWDNAFVATGHYRSGLQLSTGTAQVMLELMSGSPTTIDLHPFQVARGQAFGNR